MHIYLVINKTGISLHRFEFILNNFYLNFKENINSEDKNSENIGWDEENTSIRRDKEDTLLDGRIEHVQRE